MHRLFRLTLVSLNILVLHGSLLPADEPVKKELSPEEALQKIPFEQFTTTDKFARTITFYLSRPSKGSSSQSNGNPTNTKLPVFVMINGSGAQSVFSRYGDKVMSQLQGLALSAVKGRARVLVVEKPGVEFLDTIERPGSAIGAREEFLKEHTLERWSEAHIAAMKSVWKRPDIDTTRTLVAGHSEGSIVAARIAAEVEQVTHVACLSGGGATQLFSLVRLASAPQPGDGPGDAQKRRQKVYEEWNSVLKNPDSTKEFWLGHPNRRWSGFLPFSSASYLLKSKAKVYLAQGALDTNEAPEGFEFTVATLLANGRDVKEELIEGVEHGFMPPNQPNTGEGLLALFGRVTNWFLND